MNNPNISRTLCAFRAAESAATYRLRLVGILTWVAAAAMVAMSPASWGQPETGRDYHSVQLRSATSSAALKDALALVADEPYARIDKRGTSYALRVGFWETRKEAEQAARALKRKFPGAYARTASYRPDAIAESAGEMSPRRAAAPAPAPALRAPEAPPREMVRQPEPEPIRPFTASAPVQAAPMDRGPMVTPRKPPAPAQAAPAPAAAPTIDRGPYLGVGVGRSTASNLSGIDTTLATYGITSSSTVGNTGTAWKLYGGYQVNKYFGAEGGYANLGKYNVTSVVTVPPVGTGSGTWQVKSVLSLAAMGYLPFWERFAVFGKLGLAYSNVNFTYATPAGTAASTSSKTTSPLYGVGLKYNFSDNLSARGEFERYQNLGDSNKTGRSSINVWSLGVQYLF